MSNKQNGNGGPSLLPILGIIIFGIVVFSCTMSTFARPINIEPRAFSHDIEIDGDANAVVIGDRNDVTTSYTEPKRERIPDKLMSGLAAVAIVIGGVLVIAILLIVTG